MSFGYSHQKTINTDLFTDAYRVTGEVKVGAGGVQAVLSDQNTRYMTMSNVYISRIHTPASIIASYSECAFNKDNINFLVMQNKSDAVATSNQRSRSVFERGKDYDVFISVPSFEIHGIIKHEGTVQAASMIRNSVGAFQLVYDAKALAALYPDISYSGAVILVQKSRISIFGVNTHKQ
ncbi:MAG TPA: hypothetical protein VLL52_08545 [Anaerolineae bacterium]|nr:hypothetical protein [Anaerolineae bacterium]